MGNNEIASVLDGKFRGYQGWKAKTNEESSLKCITFLKQITEFYQVELSKIKDAYDAQKQSAIKENSDQIAAINAEESAAVDGLKLTCENILRKNALDKAQSYEDYKRDIEIFIRNNHDMGGFRRLFVRLVLKIKKGFVNEENQARMREEESYTRLKQLFENKDAIHLRFRDASIKAVNAKANIKRMNETTRYNSLRETQLDNYKNKSKELETEVQNCINAVMSQADVSAFKEIVRSSLPNATEYSCTLAVPKYIYLGDVYKKICNKADIHPEVSDCLIGAVPNALVDTRDELLVSLPFCQSIEDGISLFVNYSPTDRMTYQEHFRRILLKMFMTFPAGKLEATMIDPLELGETFAWYTKLGEEQARIIDTKIWSQEKDISDSISILRQKLETMIQSYGTDKETCLKKEPVRVLAITDFPTGFSQSALGDLQAIVRKSASYGVCVFIWANSQEINKLAASQQPVFNEIKQMLRVARADGSQLTLETAREEKVYLVFDEMLEASINRLAIINTLAKGIHSSQRKIEKFEDMFDNIEDRNNWFNESSIAELAIPIGIRGADTVVKMTLGKRDGSTEHHALIAGQTGAGKSTLLHTIIMSTLLNYSPEEVNLYLVDFKEGIEFKTYTNFNLPALRVIAIDSEREFGLNILKELCRILEDRADTFSRAKCEEISDYRKKTNIKVPKIVLIFDEIQELFRDRGAADTIAKECLDRLNKLIMQGRALGIHIILACQDFKLVPGIEVLFSQMAIRIAIKGSEDSAKSVLGENNTGAKQLQDREAGAAVYNGKNGMQSANVVFQVSYLDKEKRTEFLSKLNDFQNNINLGKNFQHKTRILLTNAEDDIFNLYNQLIIHKQTEKMFDDVNQYGLAIGEGFELTRNFRIGLSPKAKSNLLLVGTDEKKAASMFFFIILSLLYDELTNEVVRKDDQLIHLIDLSADEHYMTADNTNFNHMEALFPKQIKCVKMSGLDELIAITYDTLKRRMNGTEPTTERLILMFFGLNRAHKLNKGNMYEDQDSQEMTSISKLLEILKFGAALGINAIVWGENLAATTKMIGASIERDFAQRIVFSTDPDTMEQLVMEGNGEGLRNSTAVYMNVDEDVKNTHFRPYDIPAKIWIEKLASVYREFE